ncbi:MAG: dihydrofolate reductase [Lachnospiraceae bacterium]|nr:dihydrofolate reductase [Lachnospiraceae bacterium]
MKLIVAVDKNWAIGKNGKLLVSIPADMKFFRETTTGNVVVMGKNTLNSFPNGLPLKNRVNVVMTTNRSFDGKGAEVVYSLGEVLEEVKKYDTDRVYVIGGASVYEQLLEYCDTAYVTYIDYAYEADRYFPNLDKMEEWKLEEESEEQTYFDVEYYFRKYVRVK